MPAPTKKWGESSTADPSLYAQAPDGFIEKGFDPEAGLQFPYLNWVLNFIWSTLIGAQHNPFTGAHTAITATSVAIATSADFDIAYPNWVVDDDYKYETAPTRTAKLGLSRWQFQKDPYATNVFDNINYADIGKTMGYVDDLFVDIDDVVASTRDAVNDTVLSACSLFLQKGNSTVTATLEWFLEERNIGAFADTYSTIATGTITDADVATNITGTAFSSVVLWSTNQTLVAGREYRLRISVGTTDAHGYALHGGVLFYKPNRIIAG